MSQDTLQIDVKHRFILVESDPILGNILIILSQLMFSLMFIYEEQILKKYDVKV